MTSDQDDVLETILANMRESEHDRQRAADTVAWQRGAALVGLPAAACAENSQGGSVTTLPQWRSCDTGQRGAFSVCGLHGDRHGAGSWCISQE